MSWFIENWWKSFVTYISRYQKYIDRYFVYKLSDHQNIICFLAKPSYFSTCSTKIPACWCSSHLVSASWSKCGNWPRRSRCGWSAKIPKRVPWPCRACCLVPRTTRSWRRPILTPKGCTIWSMFWFRCAWGALFIGMLTWVYHPLSYLVVVST